MNTAIIRFAIIFLAMTGQAYAFCQAGDSQKCTINGKPGVQECDIAKHVMDPCQIYDRGASATLNPKYFVLDVIYAPPGTNGGRSSSTVSYGSGSSTGTTTSVSNSFKQSYSITASDKAGLLGSDSGEIGASFSFSRNSTDSSSLDIKKTTANTIKDDGPSKDGIDHDHDVIYLWLNPKVTLSWGGSIVASSIEWTISGSSPTDIQYLYVGWLKNPSQIPAGVMQRLQLYGITAQDFPTILQQDPFANGSSSIDAQRYQSLNMTFPYEPPYSATESVPTSNQILTFTSTSTSGTSVSTDTKVGLTVTGDLGIVPALNLKLKTDDSWDWTNMSSTSSSIGSSESASVTIGGPGVGYSGPTDIQVYYDTLYKTFLFAPLEGVPIAFRGTVTGSAGKVAPGTEVTATANGVTYHTFTDAKGYHGPGGHPNGQ